MPAKKTATTSQDHATESGSIFKTLENYETERKKICVQIAELEEELKNLDTENRASVNQLSKRFPQLFPQSEAGSSNTEKKSRMKGPEKEELKAKILEFVQANKGGVGMGDISNHTGEKNTKLRSLIEEIGEIKKTGQRSKTKYSLK